MNMDITEATVQILGKTYHIRCSALELIALEQAAQYLETRLQATRQTSDVFGSDRIAIITALNLANELLALKEQNECITQLTNQKLRELQAKMDDALTRFSQMELEPVTEI